MPEPRQWPGFLHVEGLMASTSDRGYGTAHQRMREQWAATVDTVGATCHAMICLMPTRWIAPGSPWDLGHNEQRTDWTGPEHRRCNRSAGAVKSNQPWRTPRRRRAHPDLTVDLDDL